MSSKTEKGFAPVPNVLMELAAAAPGGAAYTPTNPPKEAAPTKEVVGEGEATQQEMPFAFPTREASQKMSLNVPMKLYEDLRIYSKLTDVAMSEVIIAGTRAELERRKKKYGI